MNINLGAPYEAAIRKIVEKGYAATQTEVIRQAILAYERMLEEDELSLVHRAVEIEMRDIASGRTVNHTLEEVKKSMRKGAR